MISEVVEIACLVEIATNVYATGDSVAVFYRHGATEGACLDANWIAYTVPFDSLGYIQVRLESTL
jgi:hypothetical protein